MIQFAKIAPVFGLLFLGAASGQSQAPNASQVLMYSGVNNLTVPIFNATGNPIGSVTLNKSIPNIFSGRGDLAGTPPLTDATTFTPNSAVALISGILNQSIATSLSVIPISAPASGVIIKLDPLTGGELPARSSSLGPIFTERAETIGKGNFFIGISNQTYHFTSFNGRSLNSLPLLYGGGDKTNLVAGPTPLSTYPVTYNLGADVRISQDIAYLTYGVTSRFDVSVGLPLVHSGVAARMYNGISWDGSGAGNQSSSNPNCWCATSFTPGTPTLLQPNVGSSSYSKTGFGDLIIRAKGTVLERPGAVLALGADLRLPTGDEQNFLGAGAASFKPFAAVSLYSKPFANGMVLSPHATVGWQFVGQSLLGGSLTPSLLTASSPLGSVSYFGAPFTATKDYLPDVLSWSVGAELALGRHNTIAVDILGNEIGLIHGILNTKTSTSAQGFLPCSAGVSVNCASALQSVPGLISAGRVSLGQYTGSFGYKARVWGNLIATFNALVRLDDNGLVARFSPMFGLGYSFGK